jgi:hypothetical protein
MSVDQARPEIIARDINCRSTRRPRACRGAARAGDPIPAHCYVGVGNRASFGIDQSGVLKTEHRRRCRGCAVGSGSSTRLTPSQAHGEDQDGREPLPQPMTHHELENRRNTLGHLILREFRTICQAIESTRENSGVPQRDELSLQGDPRQHPAPPRIRVPELLLLRAHWEVGRKIVPDVYAVPLAVQIQTPWMLESI